MSFDVSFSEGPEANRIERDRRRERSRDVFLFFSLKMIVESVSCWHK